MGRRSFVALASILAGGLGAFWVARGLPTGTRSWIPGLDEEVVLVLLIGSPRSVADIRTFVEPARILAETPGAIALENGRIIAADRDAVGAILPAAGWLDRRIEIYEPASFTPAGSAPVPAEADPDLAALARKPTLTRAEAMRLLESLR